MNNSHSISLHIAVIDNNAPKIYENKDNEYVYCWSWLLSHSTFIMLSGQLMVLQNNGKG